MYGIHLQGFAPVATFLFDVSLQTVMRFIFYDLSNTDGSYGMILITIGNCTIRGIKPLLKSTIKLVEWSKKTQN